MKYEPARMKQDGELADKNENDDYVFSLFTEGQSENQIWCKIGGVEVKVVIDSGTRYNVVDRQSWAELKANNITTIMRQKKVDIGFRSYGGHRLSFQGMFEAIVEVGPEQQIAKFYVANEIGKLLLGYETAKLLKELKIGEDINNIEEVSAEGEFSKIKGIVVDIPMRVDIKPVC